MNKSNGTSCCGAGSAISLLETLGLRIFIDPSKCNGCGLCEEICPFGLPEREQDHYMITTPNECIECSACQRNCPNNAVVMEEQKGCGCLWDARKKAKGKRPNNNTCC
jgi:ferredoxin